MNKKTYGIFAAIIVILIGGVWLAKGRQADRSPQSRPVIRVGIVKEVEDVALSYDFAKDKGFFSKHGIDVAEAISATKNSDILVSGDADVKLGGYNKAIAMYLSGVDVKLLSNSFYPFSFYAVSRFPKEQSSKIKNVLVSEFAPDSLIIADAALERLGVNPDSVKMVAVSEGPARIALLEQGKADFMISYSSALLNKTEAVKKFHIFGTNEILKDNIGMRGVISTERALKAKPEAIRSFLEAYEESLDYMASHSDEVVAYAESKYGMTKDQASDLYTRFSFSRIGLDFVPDLGKLSSLAEKVKVIAKSSSTKPMDGFVYPAFAEAIMKARK